MFQIIDELLALAVALWSYLRSHNLHGTFKTKLVISDASGTEVGEVDGPVITV